MVDENVKSCPIFKLNKGNSNDKIDSNIGSCPIFKMTNSMEKEVVSVQTALSNLKGFLNRIKNMEKERNLANREVNKPCATSMACYMDPLFSMRKMVKQSR